MASTDNSTVLVTGVSTGIGHAIAGHMVVRGAHVFGSVRSLADAERLQIEFGKRFTPLIFDVTDEATMAESAVAVRHALEGHTLTGLVNNAGIAVGGPLLDLPTQEFRKQLEVNLTGTLIATKTFLPLLGTDEKLKGKPGRIVNIGSVGGRHAFPFMAPYHVTKYGMEGFTEALRRELIPYGIDAILVAPGSVATPIWEKGEAKADDYSRYDGTVYEEPLKRFLKTLRHMDESGLPPERIAEKVYEALTVNRPKPYYRVTNSELTFQALTKLPKRWVDALVARQLKLPRRDG